jgi:hypothetical protein
MAFAQPVLARNRAYRQSRIALAIGTMPDTETCITNLLSIFDSATDDELSSGSVWYSDRAAQVCADIITAGATAGHRITRRQASGILAALSPSTSWGNNCAGAIEFVLTGHCTVQDSRNNEKARRILAGEAPETVLGGRKVRSFFKNIAEPFAPGPVTIDRHALSILFGKPLNEREQKVLGKVGAYTFAASIYRTVARRLGIAPHELQAITWQTWRRLHGQEWRDEAFGTFDF